MLEAAEIKRVNKVSKDRRWRKRRRKTIKKKKK